MLQYLALVHAVYLKLENIKQSFFFQKYSNSLALGLTSTHKLTVESIDCI